MPRRTTTLHNFFKWFSKTLQEPHGGGPSAMRLAAFLVVGNVMLVWSILCLWHMEWQAMGWDMIVMVLSVLGVKAWQRGLENKPPSEEDHR